MTIDLQYLLFLQGIRIATGGALNEFFNAISKFAVDMLPFFAYIIFWCVSKKWGYRFVTTLWLGEMVNGIIKLTVCCYRPWIRSAQIEPAGDSKVAATGYSFPSGHTVQATMNYGTIFVWQRQKRRWLAVLCVVMIVLTAFSRNFLGVHTPQDVIVGFLEASVLIFIVGKVQNRVSGNERLLDGLTLAGIVAIIVALVYVTQKPYPMDYVEGVLIVDPQVMMNDMFKACGGFLGFLLGSYIERHKIHYEIPEGSAKLPILGCVGMALMLAWKQWFAGATVVAAFGGHWGNLISRFLMVMFAMTLWPWFIMKQEAAQ